MRRKCGHVALFHSGAEFVFGNYGTLVGAVECAGSIREMGSSGKAHRTAWAFVPDAVLPTHIMMNLAVRIAGRPGVGTV
jgi:hypothetical protein